MFNLTNKKWYFRQFATNDSSVYHKWPLNYVKSDIRPAFGSETADLVLRFIGQIADALYDHIISRRLVNFHAYTVSDPVMQ